jgi:hypothetical protein
MFIRDIALRPSSVCIFSAMLHILSIIVLLIVLLVFSPAKILLESARFRQMQKEYSSAIFLPMLLLSLQLLWQSFISNPTFGCWRRSKAVAGLP